MKAIWTVGGVLALLPSLQAYTLTLGPTDVIFTNATAIYQVVADAHGVNQAGFTTSPLLGTLQFSYTALKGSDVTAATLDLASSIGDANDQPTFRRVLEENVIGKGHSAGTDPSFSSAQPSPFFTISGPLGGTQTLYVASATGYNLLPVFEDDLEAGNTLTVNFEMRDAFAATSPGGEWKNQTATYTVTRSLPGSFGALTTVDYSAAVPEPLSMALVGAGLTLLGVIRKRKRD